MKKTIVYLIILFVIIGLSGVIYLIDKNPTDNKDYFDKSNYSESQKSDANINIENININEPTSSNAASDIKIPKTFSIEEIQKNNSRQSCWTVIREDVYDLTGWINSHPGGPEKILSLCGRDGTDAFLKNHSGQNKPEETLLKFKIGQLE